MACYREKLYRLPAGLGQSNIIKFCCVGDELMGVGITATALHCDSEDCANTVTGTDDL